MILRRCLLLLPLSLLLLASPASGEGREGHADHARHAPATEVGDFRNVDVELHDLELVSHDGRTLRFRRDVIGDRLVVMAFTYTSCTTVCPIYGGLFREVQELLGDRLGSEVGLVTLTLDPTTDVPPRLAREARRYHARPGWVYLTGDKKNVDEVLRGLDAYAADVTQHPPMVLVGDGRTDTWQRFNGFPRPQDLVAALDALGEARHASHDHP